MLSRILSLLLVVCLLPRMAFSQVPRKNFLPGSLTENEFTELKKLYGNKKEYPPQLEKQILVALSFYPELKNTPIQFQSRPHHSPGYTRVTWGGLFEPPQKRHFIIVISDSTEEHLMPLIFKNLSFNAQIGLIGHELGHVSDFLTKTTLEIIQHVFNNVSANYIDRFERDTDARCIAHGLGYQLLEWSRHVREEMNTVNWDGPDHVNRLNKRDRYMNPDKILAAITSDPIYKTRGQ